MKIKENIKASLVGRQGFTLVELLLVMAIIGILAGVIFVTTAPARKKARITTFKQHMKDLATAGSVCIDSEGSIFDAAGAAGSTSADGTSVFCTAVSAVDTVPEIKECKGGGGYINLSVNGDSNNDDFVITATCPVTGTTISCYAECTVNGCKFSNDATFADVDGCPKT